MTSMKIISWNVRFQGLAGRIQQVVEALRTESPDIVLLQEVTDAHLVRVVEGLANFGLTQAVDSSTDAPERPPESRGGKARKGYSTLIASHWPVERADDKWRTKAPYPEAVLRATVSPADAEPLDVFNVHIPNGSGNGWRKILTLDVLYAALTRGADCPRILAGDFNEPRQYRRSGQIVSWGPRLHDDGGISDSHKRRTDRFGTTRPVSDWSRGVLRVLGGASHHGLRDVYRAVHGFDRVPVTHVTTKGRPRCFDHGFVSRHFEIIDANYHHGWRERRLSDHSPLWFRLQQRDEVPDLYEWAVAEPESEDDADA